MVFVIALAAVVSAPQMRPASNAVSRVTVEASATVRIVTGARLTLDASGNRDAPKARDSLVATPGGPRPARLIEFQ